MCIRDSSLTNLSSNEYIPLFNKPFFEFAVSACTSDSDCNLLVPGPVRCILNHGTGNFECSMYNNSLNLYVF